MESEEVTSNSIQQDYQSRCGACGCDDVIDDVIDDVTVAIQNGALSDVTSDCSVSANETERKIAIQEKETTEIGTHIRLCKTEEGDRIGLTNSVRELTVEEQEKLDKDTNLLTEFKQSKLEREAQKNWDLFYKRNTTKFFKDRHWTRREFGELVNKKAGEPLVVFEVGCGVGNFMFPLLQEDLNIYFYACDFSKRAVQFVKENPRFDAERCTAFHCDITEDDLSSHIPSPCVDVATMIFVLSAVHPDKMVASLNKIFQVLKPGGCLLIRDYGLYDHAMLRFTPGHKLADNFYVRQDGTRAYYFSLDTLRELMSNAGYVEASCSFVQRQTVNKKEGLSVPRIFVQGKFVKPNT